MEKNCKHCTKPSVIFVDSGETSLCAFHYIKQEDQDCLKAYLLSEIDLKGKITESKEIQSEIKKQMPELYNQLDAHFTI